LLVHAVDEGVAGADACGYRLPVEPPAERGFGTRLIERACTYELAAEVELDYRFGGLRCEVMFPLT
jgi:two-component sensor histidine kinase